MEKFKLHFPTTIHFGPGEFSTLGEVSKSFGSKALVVSYPGSTGIPHILEQAEGMLRQAGVETVKFDRIEPNPRHSTCDAGAGILLENSCDHIIAIGGGSVMDAGKAISAAAANGGSCWEYVRKAGGAKPVERAIPIITVPTTAATGSEANPEAVISNWETHEKCVIVGPPLLAPKVALCDPELHASIPKEVTADGVVDIVSHVLDCYVSGADDCSIQDEIAEGLIRLVLKQGPAAIQNGDDLKARGDLQLASIFAISDLALAGRKGTWLMHNIEHAVSAHYDIPHGRGMAIVIPRVLRYLKADIARRLAGLGRNCFAIDADPEEVAAERTISALVTWFGSIGRNLTFADVGIGKEKFEIMANDIVTNDGDGTHYHSVRKLNRKEIVEVLELCTLSN